MSTPRRSRRIKKTPLLTKIKSYPFDLFLSINESLAILELDNLPETYHLYIGLFADALMLLIRLYFERFQSRRKRDEALLNSMNNNRAKGGAYYSLSAAAATKRRSNGAVYSVLLMAFVALFAASIINAAVCLLATKKYTLFGRDMNNKPDTPSAVRTTFSEDTNMDAASTASPFKQMIRKRLSGIMSPAPAVEQPSASAQVWELNVWEPSLFHLNIFALFSPIHVVALWLGPLSFVQLMVVLPAFSLSLYALSHMFLVLIKDKNVIASEVFGEYDKKVVRPLLGVVKQDAAVGADGSCEFYDAALDNKFVLRDVRPSHTPPAPVQLGTPTRRRTFAPTSGQAPSEYPNRHFTHRLMDDRRGSSGYTPSNFSSAGPSHSNHTTMSGSPVGRPWKR